MHPIQKWKWIYCFVACVKQHKNLGHQILFANFYTIFIGILLNSWDVKWSIVLEASMTLSCCFLFIRNVKWNCFVIWHANLAVIRLGENTLLVLHVQNLWHYKQKFHHRTCHFIQICWNVICNVFFFYVLFSCYYICIKSVITGHLKF